MSSETFQNISGTKDSAQLILQNVAMMTELCSYLRRETKNGENCLNTLSNIILQAGKDVSSLNQCVDSLLVVAKKMVYLSLQVIPADDSNFKSLKNEADKVLTILEEIQNDDDDHKGKNSLKRNLSLRSLNFDEKYPEHCSKECLLDMNGIGSLPTVHEDIFTNFNKPSRSLSSSSLKNLRKVKKCLQRVSDDDDDDEVKRSHLMFPKNTKDDYECSPEEQTVAYSLGHIQEVPNF